MRANMIGMGFSPSLVDKVLKEKGLVCQTMYYILLSKVGQLNSGIIDLQIGKKLRLRHRHADIHMCKLI